MTLHANSLGIPKTQLAACLGIKTLAAECARELIPVYNQTSGIVYDRDEVNAWWRAKKAERNTP